MTNQEKIFTGEIGIHYPLHVLNRYSLPELIGLAERAWQTMEKLGFGQVWTNDNLEYRSVLASSAAIAARVPVKLGTAVTVPYFRNPVDLAMAFATISELTNGREISLGLGPGSRSILKHQVERAKPLAIMAELATGLRKLFAGEALRSSEIPILASYFHMNAEQYTLRFKTRSPIRLYYGPSLLKPAVLDLVARHFDGVILQTLYGIADMEASLARLRVGAVAIRAARTAAQSHAAQRVGFPRRPGGQTARQKIRFPHRIRLAGRSSEDEGHRPAGDSGCTASLRRKIAASTTPPL